jgi:DNA-binding transcriptional ArsR family regulator
LSTLEEYGGTSAHALAEIMDIPHARMVRLLRVLTEAGLVTAGRGPDRLYRVPE